jgi:DNA-binding MarR family transcriptional regulator
VAFLLAQVGAHAAARFAERLAALSLTPPEAGILRLLGGQSDMLQRELCDTLGIFPSRLVLLLDELERKGLVERHSSPTDRRSHALRLTPKGTAQLQSLRRIGRQHQDDLCAGLTDTEREQLRRLLEKVAAQQQLRPGVHPGYRRLKEGT